MLKPGDFRTLTGKSPPSNVIGEAWEETVWEQRITFPRLSTGQVENGQERKDKEGIKLPGSVS